MAIRSPCCPDPFVRVTLSETKGLDLPLRANSVKDLKLLIQ
jgi:hypothetical protein